MIVVKFELYSNQFLTIFESNLIKILQIRHQAGAQFLLYHIENIAISKFLGFQPEAVGAHFKDMIMLTMLAGKASGC